MTTDTVLMSSFIFTLPRLGFMTFLKELRWQNWQEYFSLFMRVCQQKI